jgi:hypothetical protein
MAARDRRMTLKLMEDQLHVKWKTTDQTVRRDVAQTTSCVKFLAHNLTDEQTQHIQLMKNLPLLPGGEQLSVSPVFGTADVSVLS